MSLVEEVLSDYGLSKNEILVYLAAIQTEETSPYGLSKDTGIPRTTVYDVITDLSLKGLLELERSDGFTKQQTRVRAVNPSVLRDKLRENRGRSFELEVDLLTVLPQLKGDFYTRSRSIMPGGADMQYYPGVEGAGKVYLMESNLEVDLPHYVFSKMMPMDALGSDLINADIDRQYERDKFYKNNFLEVVPDTEWAKHVISYQFGRDSRYMDTRKIRMIDFPGFEQFMRLTIVGESVFGVSTEASEAWGFVFRSKAFSSSLKSIHQLLWASGQVIDEKVIASWGKNEYLEVEKKRGV